MSSTLSYLSTPVVGGYMYESLPERLHKLALEDGDREAFVYYDRNMTRDAISRKQLNDQSLKLAKVLVAEGLKQNSTVGFCMTNSINMLVGNMAVVCAGGVPFYMGTNLKDGSDIINVMNDMKCETLLIDTDGDDANWRILDHMWPETAEQSTAVPSLKTLICNGAIPSRVNGRVTLTVMLNICPDDNIKLPEIQPEDTLACFCTSGSTGKPKVVICSHFSMFNNAKQLDHVFDFTGDGKYFNDRTFSWVMGYPRIYLTEGTTRVFVDPQLTTSGQYTEQVAKIIEQEKCDTVFVPNYLAVDMLDHRHLSPKFRNVKTIQFAGERVPKAYASFKGSFCQNVAILYGSTESLTVSVFHSDNADINEDGIIGKPIGGVEIKLINTSGNVVPHGTEGEICTRASGRFSGYHDNEATFRATVDDLNWVHTGDIARVREDGNLVISGREKELISMQTNKFFPWSIEQTLKKMSGVLQAFAVGVPDKRSFQVVCACVVPKEGVSLTVDAVKKFCDDVFMEESSAMVITAKPAYYVILQSVPLTSSGKVNRLGVAALAREALGL